MHQNTHIEDQLKAATAEARAISNTFAGLPGSQPARQGHSTFLNQLLDTHGGPHAPRCEHLAARPVQPWTLVMPWPRWRCRPCLRTFHRQATAQLLQGHSLGHIEEHTCDGCRRYLPTETLTGAHMRQDLWLVIANLCQRCAAAVRRDGAEVLEPRR